VKSEQEFQIPNIDPDFGLWRLLDHTRFMISRLRQKELDQVGLTPEQAYILDIMVQNGGTTNINHIAGITMRRHHSISTQIERMEKQGLVKKKRSTRDRREFGILITEKGQELFKQIKRDSMKQVFACLSEEDKKELDIRLRSLLINAYNLNGKEYKQYFQH
jgi:MarR family transcriptional regulator, organic hydroperoxide resistance regulator